MMDGIILEKSDLKAIAENLLTQQLTLNHASFAEQFDTGDGVPPLEIIELLTSIGATASNLANLLVNRYID